MMESSRYEHTYPSEKALLVRVGAGFRLVLWELLKKTRPQIAQRSYKVEGAKVLVGESDLRLKALKSNLIISPVGYLLNNRASITDHHGIPFTTISFLSFGVDLKELLGSTSIAFIGGHGKEIRFPYEFEEMPVSKVIFSPPNILFSSAFRRTLIATVENGEYYPLTVGGGYLSHFQESLRKHT